MLPITVVSKASRATVLIRSASSLYEFMGDRPGGAWRATLVSQGRPVPRNASASSLGLWPYDTIEILWPEPLVGGDAVLCNKRAPMQRAPQRQRQGVRSRITAADVRSPLGDEELIGRRVRIKFDLSNPRAPESARGTYYDGVVTNASKVAKSWTVLFDDEDTEVYTTWSSIKAGLLSWDERARAIEREWPSLENTLQALGLASARATGGGKLPLPRIRKGARGGNGGLPTRHALRPARE